jgi:D-alanine-D-alanine ligase
MSEQSTSSNKLTIGWFFGGKATEHEVSVITALQAFENLNDDKYNVIPIYVSKQGEFFTNPKFLDIKNYQDIDSLVLSSTKITLGQKDGRGGFFSKGLLTQSFISLDVAFPLFHGSFGEDGCIQGVFELYNIPYVGLSVMG